MKTFIEIVEAKRADAQRAYDQALANVHAIKGALQMADALLAELREPEPAEAPAPEPAKPAN